MNAKVYAASLSTGVESASTPWEKTDLGHKLQDPPPCTNHDHVESHPLLSLFRDLGIQVYKHSLHWALQPVNIIYTGLHAIW